MSIERFNIPLNDLIGGDKDILKKAIPDIYEEQPIPYRFKDEIKDFKKEQKFLANNALESLKEEQWVK